MTIFLLAKDNKTDRIVSIPILANNVVVKNRIAKTYSPNPLAPNKLAIINVNIKPSPNPSNLTRKFHHP